jgi:hypothetical protein
MTLLGPGLSRLGSPLTNCGDVFPDSTEVERVLVSGLDQRNEPQMPRKKMDALRDLLVWVMWGEY